MIRLEESNVLKKISLVLFIIIISTCEVFALGVVQLKLRGINSSSSPLNYYHFIDSVYKYDKDSTFLSFTLDESVVNPKIDNFVYCLKIDISESFESYMSHNYRTYPFLEPKYIDKNFPYVAYIEYNGIKFGRDSINWGPGKFGNLILSDASHFFDHLTFSKKFGNFKFLYMFATLNDYLSKEEFEIQSDTNYFAREKYFLAHRIEFTPLKNVTIGFTEGEIIGGKSPGFELINPIFIYHNSYSEAVNVIAGIDFEYRHNSNNVYLSFASDDLDLGSTLDNGRPSAIGYLGGFEKDYKNFKLNFEYGRTTKYIYNRENEYQKFTNRRLITPTDGTSNFIIDYPIGYFTGPDAETFILAVNSEFADFTYKRIYKGENSVSSFYPDTEFKGDWYKLSGKIETIDDINLLLKYRNANISLNKTFIKNYENKETNKAFFTFSTSYKFIF